MKTLYLIVFSVLLSTLISTNTLLAQQINADDLKTNISKVKDGISTIKLLEPITFQYDSKKSKELGNQLPTGNQLGFLQSEVSKNYPDLIKTNSFLTSAGKNSTKVNKVAEVDKTELIPVLVAAIQEQQEQIESLRKEIIELKSQREKTD